MPLSTPVITTGIGGQPGDDFFPDMFGEVSGAGLQGMVIVQRNNPVWP